jgi:poly-gamma-glutamate system protein
MKKVYWRPTRVPRIILIVISFLAIAGMLSIELFKVKKKQPYYDEKIQAAQTMKKGIDVIRSHRLKYYTPINTEVDPTASGIIGLPASIITTNSGYLPAKQTTINPNWAAVMVDMLKEAGVKQGDVVAMGLSGSFPAMNLAAYAASDVLKLKVIAISSASASTWGANNPKFTWLDMERILKKAGVISCQSAAASLGGEQDKAMGTTKRSRKALRASIKRNKVQFIEVNNAEESIEKRINLFHELSQGKPIAAYINIGGGRASVGPKTGKKRYKPGLNRKPSQEALKIDSVTTRFARTNVPIIHIYRINDLAAEYGLPKAPKVMPKVGGGHIFTKLEYNLYLVAGNLVILLFISYLFLKLDIGYRIFGSTRITETPKHPEPMV